MKKSDEDSVSITLPKQVVNEIMPLVDALGLSVECALHCTIIVSSLRVGLYKTKAAYAQAIRKAEKEFGVKLAKHMPPYVKSGDLDYISKARIA